MAKPTKKQRKYTAKTAAGTINMEWVLTLLLGFVALVPILGLYGFKYGYSPDLHMGSLLQIVSMLVLGFILYKGYKQLSIPIGWLTYIVVGFYLWSVITLLWAINRYEGSLKLLDWGAGVLAFFLIVLLIQKQPKSLNKYVLILYCSGVVAGVLSVCQVWFGYAGIPQAVVPGSFFSNKNMSAQYMLLTIPLGWYLLLRYKKLWLQLLLGISIGMMSAVIAYTTARAAWVSAFTQLIVVAIYIAFEWFYHQNKLINKQRLCALVMALIVFVSMIHVDKNGFDKNVLASYASELKSIQTTASGQNSVRHAIWKNSVEMIREHWFKGIGLGNWVVEYPVYHQRVVVDPQMSIEVKHDNAHNDYIEIITELGLLGFLLFCAMIGLTLKYAWVLLSVKSPVNEDRESVSSPSTRTFIAMLLVSMAGIGVDAMFSFPLQQPVPVYWCFMIMGMIYALYGLQPKLHDNRWSINKHMAQSIGGLAIVAALVLTIMHSYWYQSELYKRKAIIASKQSDFDAVKINAEKAYQLKPFHAELLHAIGVGLREQGKVREAITYIERSLQYYPHTLTYLTNMVDTYVRARDFENAIRHIEHLIEISPNNFMMHRLYGLILINEYKEIDKGISYLEKAIDTNSNHALADKLRQRIALERSKNRQKIETNN